MSVGVLSPGPPRYMLYLLGHMTQTVFALSHNMACVVIVQERVVTLSSIKNASWPKPKSDPEALLACQ